MSVGIQSMIEVAYLLKLLAAEPSKTGKIGMLAKHDSDLLRRVLRAALDPAITYGVKKLPDRSPVPGMDDWSEEIWMFLDRLAKRDLTGHASARAISGLAAALRPECAEVLYHILAKDLRCGVDAKTANAAFPGLIPVFEAMLAHPYDPERVASWPVMVQPKLDGVRVIVIFRETKESIQFLSRSGKEFTSFGSLRDPLYQMLHARGMFNVMLDGEVLDGDFLSSVSAVRKKGKDSGTSVLHLFDTQPLDTFESYTSSFSSQHERLEYLNATLAGAHPRVQIVPYEVAEDDDAVMRMYHQLRARGLEGVIVKDANALYTRKRSYAWMKIKDCQSVDLLVLGVQPGTGKYEGQIGALLCAYEGTQVAVGSGLTDELRKRPAIEFLGRVVEVEYHEVTKAGSLRHPRFVKFRDALTGAHE